MADHEQPHPTTSKIIDIVQNVLGDVEKPVPLHTPSLRGNAWEYVKQCIDTGWVSSAGAYVSRFEEMLVEYTGSKYAIATVNGTAALHIALKLAGVEPNEEVLMPSLTFVATANAASYCGATCHFVDVDETTLGIDADRLAQYLEQITTQREGQLFNTTTGKRIAGLVCMHTFGQPCDMDKLVAVCERFNLPLIEDAAESLGSLYKGKHTGTFGLLGTLSFNGNKIITTGGGGAILTDNEQLADVARHITTTAKLPHRWAYHHDEIGYNYRMPNINAALGCSQIEILPQLIEAKRTIAKTYIKAFAPVSGATVFTENDFATSNYWLNVLMLETTQLDFRDELLNAMNDAKILVRPIWQPMHQLPMYCHCPHMELPVTESLAGRIINLPSTADLVDAIL